ncbi:MAG TPA: DUF2332 domain-containing protein [Egibacteraceae bacterium]|nr:DUF2332 domain-containing protein [Egibacteraceae bacterium]
MIEASDPQPPAGADLRELTAWFVEQQAEASARLGSLLYAALMRHAAQDVRAGGVTWRVLAPHASADRGSALTLRFLAAVHRLVLQGRAPALAASYPSAGGSGDVEGAWQAFHATLEEHEAELVEVVGWSCQTNEVGRAAGLVCGFLRAVARTGVPRLRLLELGASAGLQLRWDHFRYEWDEHPDTHHWGPPDSPVVLSGHWDPPAELLAQRVEVVERRGCDPDPVDVTTEEGRLRLRQSVWADQPERFARLNGALELAARIPAEVERARAVDWVPAALAGRVPGTLTVLYHSVVWQYLEPGERDEVRDAIHRAGARATADAPLAWVRSEPENILRAMRVRLTLWPGGQEELVAKAAAHGLPVRWQTVRA